MKLQLFFFLVLLFLLVVLVLLFLRISCEKQGEETGC